MAIIQNRVILGSRLTRVTLSLLMLGMGIIGIFWEGDWLRYANAGIGDLGPVECEISVHIINLDGAINPVSERYLLRELERAQDPYSDERARWYDDNRAGDAGEIITEIPPGKCSIDADSLSVEGLGSVESLAPDIDRGDLVVIILDTPGGLLDSTRNMVNAILESRVPVAVYVSPSGAHAASAGTFIGAAANILAMAPVTEIGAAAVVGGQGEDLGETLEVKANEDAAALIRGIAEKRRRNVEALEATVFEAKAYSAEEAVEMGIADVIANDLDELLGWLEGKSFETAEGLVTIRNLQRAQIEERNYSIWDQFLGVIANPNLAFLLISLGSLALVVELWNFGTFIPGTIGVVLLVLGFAGVGQLPFQWAGIILIVVAIALLAAEIFVTPGFGFFGISGVIALILGGLFLFPSIDVEAPELPGGQIQVSLWLLGTMGSIVLSFVIWMIWELRKVSRPESYIPTGSSSLVIGTTVPVIKTLDPEGEVYAAGEHWTARTSDRSRVDEGTTVRVLGVDGLTLIVDREIEDD